MAPHKLSILVEAIGAAKASKELAGVDRTISNIGGRAGKGLATAGKNLAGLGAIAVGGIALAVHTGLQDLATLESAVTSVDGAIKQMGQTGQVTGGQVATWANEIEASIGAAFDDKDITKSTATLIRYGKVTPKNLRPAMVVMTDLAAKTGSVESASTLLSKALADPTKAAGKLARQGIVLTKEQQKQIAAFVKAGKVGEAQALILDAVSKSTKGAAAASQGPYQRALSTLADVSEDARKALAEGFLPVIQKVADLLSSELAKPSTMQSIRDFGNGLASGLDSLINIAKNLPWSAIGSSLKIAGDGATSILNAFANLPPWIQTAVISGWGLNKLSGGALGDIVGELGKGLIKGVLGMNAAVVNINAGVVNGGGGTPTVPGAAPASSAGIIGAIKDAVKVAAGVTLGVAVTEAMAQIQGALATALANGNKSLETTFTNGFASIRELVLTPFEVIRTLPDRIGRILSGKGTLSDFLGPIGTIAENVATAVGVLVASNKPNDGPATVANDQTGFLNSPQGQKLLSTAADTHSEQIATTKAVDAAKVSANKGFGDNARAVTSSGQNVSGVVRSGTSGTTAATNVGSSRIVGAIQANRPVVNTEVKVYVTAAKVSSSVVTQERVGKSNGSGGSGSNGASKPT